MRDYRHTGRGGGEAGWLRDLLTLLLALAVPFVQFLGALPLLDPDEGRYAEIPREMLERGDLITPTLNYVKYFEKPPLLYWLNAASLKLFGITEFAARLPSALCGLATVLVTYWIGRRLYGRRTAMIAAAMLGTTAGFVMQSRIILTDMLLTCCLTLCLGAFIVAAQRNERRDGPLTWMLMYLGAGLAVLAKGLIGIVFPAGIIFFYLLISREWRLLGRMRLVTGLLLFLAVTVPWFVAVSVRNPEFPRFFFIHEHFERFTSTVHGRYQPIWFFVPVLLGTMFPWAVFVPGAVSRAWRNRHHDGGSAGLYLFIWAAVIFLFFSKSSSKLVPYILPIFPALALLIAERFNALLDGRGRELKLGAVIVGGMLLVLGVAALGFGYLPQVSGLLTELFPRLGGPVRQFVANAPQVSIPACLAIGGLFLLQAVMVLHAAGRNPMRMLIVLCAASFVLVILVPRLIMGDIARAESSRDLAKAVTALGGPDTRVVTFGPLQGISWYTGRRVMVTGKVDELEFGSRQGDQKAWFPDVDTVISLWGGDSHLLVVLKRHELAGLMPRLVPAPVIRAETRRYLLISNR